MKAVEPITVSENVSGCFALDDGAIKRILHAMEQHVPENAEKGWLGPRASLFILKYEDGSSLESSDISELEHFPFERRDRKYFEIKMTGGVTTLSCTYFIQPKSSNFVAVYSGSAQNQARALREVKEAVLATRTWYSGFGSAAILAFGMPAYFGLTLFGLMQNSAGSQPVPTWVVPAFGATVLAAHLARQTFFDPFVVPYGAAGRRAEMKRKMRAWIPAACGALVLAIIGGGYIVMAPGR